jgi:hypothetical protein
MKHAFEMGSGVVINTSSFIKTGLGIRKLIGAIRTNTDSMVIA